VDYIILDDKFISEQLSLFAFKLFGTAMK